MDGRPMPTINLTDDELAAVIATLHQVIDDDGYRHSPHLLPYKTLLAKLDPASARHRGAALTPSAKRTRGKPGARNR
jgi:hypothetical protein